MNVLAIRVAIFSRNLLFVLTLKKFAAIRPYGYNVATGGSRKFIALLYAPLQNVSIQV